MNETETITKPKEEKSDRSLKELQELILDVIDQAEKTDDPDESEHLLHHCARFQRKLLEKNSVLIDMIIGLRKWEKNAQRRSMRKPLTVRSAKNLAEEFHQLASILKI